LAAGLCPNPLSPRLPSWIERGEAGWEGKRGREGGEGRHGEERDREGGEGWGREG